MVTLAAGVPDRYFDLYMMHKGDIWFTYATFSIMLFYAFLGISLF